MAAPTIYQGGVQTYQSQTGYLQFDNGGPLLGRMAYTVGTFTANGTSTVTISSVPITSSSDINITLKTANSPGAVPAISTITPGTGVNGAGGQFTIVATAGDTSVYNFSITG